MKVGRQPVLGELVVDTSNPSRGRKDRTAHVAHVAQERSLLAQHMEQAAHITCCCIPPATFSLDTVQSIPASPAHPAEQPGSISPLAVLHQYQRSPHQATPRLLAPKMWASFVRHAVGHGTSRVAPSWPVPAAPAEGWPLLCPTAPPPHHLWSPCSGHAASHGGQSCSGAIMLSFDPTRVHAG